MRDAGCGMRDAGCEMREATMTTTNIHKRVHIPMPFPNPNPNQIHFQIQIQTTIKQPNNQTTKQLNEQPYNTVEIQQQTVQH
jgi:hypothetical protein